MAEQNIDPRTALLGAPMSRHQAVAVGVTVALCALDGFDVLSVTFAAPGLVQGWGIDRAMLGMVLSCGLIGMALGSFLVAPQADRIGRRPIVLGCLVLMAAAALGSSQAEGVKMLAACRLVAGLGIGGMIAVISPLAAEYSNAHRRDLTVGLMAVGFPIGGVVGGSLSAWLLAHFAWPSLFLLSGSLSLLMLVVSAVLLPEPLTSFVARPTEKSLERANLYLTRCGQPPVDILPPARGQGASAADGIFSRSRLPDTLGIAAIYFFYVITVYFLLSWLPQIVADRGFSPRDAAGVSVWANLGGVVGGTALGWGSHRFGLKPLVLCALLGMGASTALYGRLPADLSLLKAGAAVAGFFLFAGMVGLYAVLSRTFPAALRATGSGFVIGLGRGGSALAPVLAGMMFSSGLDRATVFEIMAAGALLSAFLLSRFAVRPIGF